MKNGISQYFPVLSTLQSISRDGKYRIFPPGNTGGGFYVPTLVSSSSAGNTARNTLISLSYIMYKKSVGVFKSMIFKTKGYCILLNTN